MTTRKKFVILGLILFLVLTLLGASAPRIVEAMQRSLPQSGTEDGLKMLAACDPRVTLPPMFKGDITGLDKREANLLSDAGSICTPGEPLPPAILALAKTAVKLAYEQTLKLPTMIELESRALR